MRKIVVYTYHIDEKRFDQSNDLILERDTINIESRHEHELIFAVSNQAYKRSRVAIASKPGAVYYDHHANTYRVWFNSPDRDKAIEAIGGYILDHIASEIRTHRSFVDRLRKEQAINSLESISKN